MLVDAQLKRDVAEETNRWLTAELDARAQQLVDAKAWREDAEVRYSTATTNAPTLQVELKATANGKKALKRLSRLCRRNCRSLRVSVESIERTTSTIN